MNARARGRKDESDESESDDDDDERTNDESSSASENGIEEEGPRAGDVVAFFAPPSAGEGLKLRAYSARGINGEVVSGNEHKVVRNAKDVPEFLASTSLTGDSKARLGVEDATTQLVVLRFGKYYGFRSHAAGGKLLQARRRVDSRLCFFNFNFGVCEQWALVGLEEADVGRVLTFCNRRLRAVKMRVVVKSVPRQLLPTYAFDQVDNYVDELDQIELAMSTPRQPKLRLSPSVGESPVALDTRSATASMYGEMSAGIIHEWSSSFEVEVQARRVVESEIGALKEELEVVYEDAIGEVHSIRAALDDFKSTALEHMHVTGLASVRSVQEKAVNWITNSSARKLQNISFRLWKVYAQQARLERMAVVRFMIRKDNRLISLAFTAWKCNAQYLSAIRRKDAYARARYRKRCVARCFQKWVKMMSLDKRAQAVAATAHRLGVAEKEREFKLKVFCTWRVLMKQNHHADVLRHRVVGRLQHQLVSKAFNSWRQFVQNRRLRKLALNRLYSKMDRFTIHNYFHTWRENVERVKSFTRRLLRVFKVWDQRALYAAFNTWKSAVEDENFNELRANRLHINAVRSFQSKRFRILRSSFSGWRAHAKEKVLLRTMATKVVLRMQRVDLYRAFISWKESTRLILAQKSRMSAVLSRMCRATLLNAWQTWRQVISENHHVTMDDASLRRILNKSTLRRMFSKWRTVCRSEPEEGSNAERVIKLRFTTMNHFFDRWRQVLRMKAKINEMVLSKRVTHDYYLDWYWSVFGGEFTQLLSQAGVQVIEDDAAVAQNMNPSIPKLLWSPPKSRKRIA